MRGVGPILNDRDWNVSTQYRVYQTIVDDHFDIKRLASLPCNSNTLMIYLSVS